MGFFPVDEATVDYLKATGRTSDEIDAFTAYFKAQGPLEFRAGDIDYSKTLPSTLASVRPSVRAETAAWTASDNGLKSNSRHVQCSIAENGFAQPAAKLGVRYPTRPSPPLVRQRRRLADKPLHLPGVGQPRNLVEMVDNRPTPDKVASTEGKRRTSAMATC